jgi:hypothetical protein
LTIYSYFRKEHVDNPKIRNINVFPVQSSGQTLLCLQDPQNISEKALFIPLPLYFVVSLFDGQHSILDIQAEYMRRFGDFLFTEKIQEVISQLEENLFLEGDRFQKALRQKEEAFKRASVREAAFVGKSYERDPDRLKLQLEGYFVGSEGPGTLGEKGSVNRLRGVVAPHIDFQGEASVMPLPIRRYGRETPPNVSSSSERPTPRWSPLFASPKRILRHPWEP